MKNNNPITSQMNLNNIITCFVIFALGITIGSTFFAHNSSLYYTFPFTLNFLNFSSPSSSSSLSSFPPSDHIQIAKNDVITTSISTDTTSKVITTNKTTTLNVSFNNATSSTNMSSCYYMHHMEDQELFRKASKAPKIVDYSTTNTTPKIAFMFLVRGDIPLAPLWDKFFKGHQGKFSIYVHAHPSYNGNYANNSVFHDRRVPSKIVEWGQFNMVEAELRLLANALLDQSNKRFILLSESCIPLYNFSTVYTHLINSTKSHVEAYDRPGPVGRGRYSHRMMPSVSLSQWRKGSQWFEMERALAVDVISDRKYYPLFRRFCTHSCYGDEHYLPTFVSIKFSQANSNRSLTWVNWSKNGPHPGEFQRPHVTPWLLNKLRSNYTCEYNGETTRVCFLFARKFMPGTLIRLLRFAPKLMKFD